MNKFVGTISHIHKKDDFCRVKVDIGGYLLNIVTLSLTKSFKVHKKVNVMFRGTEVAIGKSIKGFLSTGNILEAKVHEMNTGEMFSEVTLKTKWGEIKSIVASEYVILSELKVGDDVIALIKSNELSLSEG